jgi:DNA-binding response OmpR family regulator
MNPESGQQQKRILIIDDDPDAIITYRVVLQDSGYKVDSYTDAVLAYKNFREDLYDLVILDIKMPIIDGFLLYQKIKTTDSKVKICFLTATEFYYEQIKKKYGYDNFKQDSFLRKPIENKDLVDSIKKLLAPAMIDTFQ